MIEVKRRIELDIEQCAAIGLVNEEWNELYRDVCAAIRRLLNYDPRSVILADPRTLNFSKFNTVNEARQYFGNDVLFEHVFGHNPRMAKHLSDLVFGEESIVVPRKGEIGGELAMLLLLCRLRNTMSTLSVIAQHMGKRHETWVSEFLRYTVLFIQEKYEHILKAPNLDAFKDKFET